MNKQAVSARVQLRIFQQARTNVKDMALQQDISLLQSKDLDMSVRLGALLAFDALLTTAAINPIAASPGAPLSLDAPTQPLEVLVVSISVVLLAIAALLCVRGILVGEEFDVKTDEGKPDIMMQRMLAAYCTSIDVQFRMIRQASYFTIAGGIIMLFACGWIMAEKIWG